MSYEDFAPKALVPFKERLTLMLFVGTFFVMLYNVSAHYAYVKEAHSSLYMAWEQKIPFIGWFIIPYASLSILFCLVFLMPQTRLQARILGLRVLLVIFISVGIFLLFPLQYAFEKPKIEAFYLLFEGLSMVDSPYNQLPSLHVSLALIVALSIKEHIKQKALKYALLFWFLMIIISTLFTYQHHFVDLPMGLLVGLCALGFIRKDGKLVRTFTTSRHLTIGFCYLAGALIALVGILYSDFLLLEVVLGWIFIAMILVSIAYAFGLSRLLVGKNGKASWYQYAFLAPYFLGTYLAWRCYKKRLTPLILLQDKIYFGRQLDPKESASLKEIGVSHTIHLALESQFCPPFTSQTRFAMFDITTPSPQMLHQVVLAIENVKAQGVYVHCSLGLSRSVLAISAWLVYQGYTMEQIYHILGESKIDYLKRDYMQLGLELYRHYLKIDIKHKGETEL